MACEQNIAPDCFANLENVFPMRSDGLRATPEKCLQCMHKTTCLKNAMARKQGLDVRSEMIDRAYRHGVIGFFQRWSQKKSIHHLKKEDEK
ncbi:MAG: hypothetical protein GY874_09225 [Desulfobacteraceae bacterium]|nr:hypothetical protein [Desulfobacteraceae bacterium]